MTVNGPFVPGAGVSCTRMLVGLVACRSKVGALARVGGGGRGRGEGDERAGGGSFLAGAGKVLSTVGADAAVGFLEAMSVPVAVTLYFVPGKSPVSVHVGCLHVAVMALPPSKGVAVTVYGLDTPCPGVMVAVREVGPELVASNAGGSAFAGVLSTVGAEASEGFLVAASTPEAVTL